MVAGLVMAEHGKSAKRYTNIAIYFIWKEDASSQSRRRTRSMEKSYNRFFTFRFRVYVLWHFYQMFWHFKYTGTVRDNVL